MRLKYFLHDIDLIFVKKCFFLNFVLRLMIFNKPTKKFMKKFGPLYTCIFILSGILNGYGLPAKPGVIQAVQPDGSIVYITQEGNAKGKRILSADGYVLTTDSLGFYVFADKDSKGNIIPTKIREINPETRSANTEYQLSKIKQKNIVDSYISNPEKDISKIETRGIGLGETKFPSSGEHRALVILVEFYDLGFTIPNPKNYYDRMLNEPGFSDYESTGSARDYFISNSNGIFVPQFDVYGPVVLSRFYSYYGKNNYWGNDSNAQGMVIEACELLDPEIDFSIYDRDKDGLIDNVYFFYAGYGEADGGGANTIWPHSWDISQAVLRPYVFDGVRLDHYACSNEIQMLDEFMPDGIGTFCHEFSHVLGLPDLYSTTYNSAFTPFTWDILDHGSYNNFSRTPPNLSSYSRYALDWLEPEILSEGEFELLPLSESNQAFIVNTEKENEYFLFENRQQIGFDEYIPGHGMLIWHIDFDMKKWMNNTVNNTPAHQNVDLIEANNKKVLSQIGNASFPGGGNITEFSCQTVPAFVNWRKEAMPLRIYNISENENGTVTFSVENCPAASIENIEDTPQGLYVNGNSVSVTGKCTIYSIDGRKVADLNNSACRLHPGIYVCRLEEGVKKLLIP